MKLLLDENIPEELAPSLRLMFPIVEHVQFNTALRSSDSAIWQYAKRNTSAIVTKDSDFFYRSQQDQSVKVIWIRYGNCSVAQFEDWIRSDAERIRAFLQSGTETCIALPRPGLKLEGQ